MNTTEHRKLVTIVAEAVLTEAILAAVERLGVSGYTVSDARGKGSRGRRTGEIPGENVKVEILASEASANRMLEMLAEKYFPDYAIVAWVVDADVVRGEKYS